MAAIAFVYRFLPETKNRPVEEITELFEEQVATGPPKAEPPTMRAAA